MDFWLMISFYWSLQSILRQIGGGKQCDHTRPKFRKMGEILKSWSKNEGLLTVSYNFELNLAIFCPTANFVAVCGQILRTKNVAIWSHLTLYKPR